MTEINIQTALKSINSIGLYTYMIYKDLAPGLANLLFGQEQFGINPSKKVTLRDILIDSTTSKDGKSVEYRDVTMINISTTVDGSVSASTSVTLTSVVGFSKGDLIKFQLVDGTEIKRVITDINVGSRIITVDSAVTLASGNYVTRISYTKEQGAAIDRLTYNPTVDAETNYFQDFGTQLLFTLQDINSHLDVFIPNNGMPNPKSSSKTRLDDEQNAFKNFMNLKVSQALGREIIGDVCGSFFQGKKQQLGNRFYAGGLDDVIGTEVSIDCTEPDEQVFEKIWNQIYHVRNRSVQAGNTKVVIVCNDAFQKKFATLSAGKVIFSEVSETYGYKLQTLSFADAAGAQSSIQLMYESKLDGLQFIDIQGYSKAIAYIIPLDLVSAKVRKYSSVEVDNSGKMIPQLGSFDVKVQKAVATQDTMDTFKFYMLYNMTFVHGGRSLGIYKKLVLTNI